MSELPVLNLKSDRPPGGPWVFARELQRPEVVPPPGALVELQDASGRYLGHGFCNPASDIRVRLLSTGRKSELDRPREFLLKKLTSADRLRRRTLRLPDVTDAYRVAHAEGDDLSGLIVDRLGDVLVCEHHALGFWLARAEVEWALRRLYPEARVVHRVPATAAKKEGFEPEPEALEPELGEVAIHEHGVTYLVTPAGGHKTGFFCDQRDNRRRVAELARERDVFDLCCNTGGFGLSALHAGARRVRAVDLDEVVLERASASAEANGLEIDFVHADVFDFLRGAVSRQETAALVVLDPHKLVRDKARMEEGLAKYGDMNALALEVVRPGGLLATFSCSGAVDLPTFCGLVFRAARRARREVRLLETMGAAPDHPQRPDFARSRYLKGLLLAVD